MASIDFLTALKDPNAWFSQHLSLTVAGLKSPINVLEITINEEMNALPELDILIASDDQTLDGFDFLGKNATLIIEERAALKYSGTASRHARTMHGVAMEWEHRSSSKDEAKYWLRVKPRIALLGLQTYSAVYLNKTLKEIFYELLVDRERIWPHDVELNFEGLDQRHEQILMVDESPIDFFKRLCLLHGLYFYFKYADVTSKTHRDTLVVDNRPNGYMRSIDVPFVPANGLSGQFHEAVLTIKRKQTLASQSVGLRDHNYRTPDAPVTALAYVDRGDDTLSGSIDRSNEHFHTKEEGQALTTVRAEAIDSRRHVHSGTTNIIGLYPGWVLNVANHKLPRAPYGLIVFKVKTTGSRTKPVTNEFEGTPADKTWRPDFVPERDWRWMQGSLIATIESSVEGSPYADLDEHGRYLVRFHFHTRAGKAGSNSMRLRLMTPSASKDGGFHAPLLPGTEVRIFFTNGDIDRAYIGAAVHDYSRANHVHGYQGWNSRAVWRSPLLSGKVRFEDFKGKEGAKFATTYMQTSVSMGYLVDNQKQRRGEGFEINTAGHGTFHAAKGMLLSADALSSPNAPHLEMQAVLTQLQAAQSQAESMSSLAQQAAAELAEVKSQQAQLDHAFKDLQKAVILLSAPEGIGVVTPKDIQLSSGRNITATASVNADFSVLKRFTVAAGEAISLFAQRTGLKLLAGSGKVQVQAQGDAMELAALRDVSISSSNGRVVVAADREILLTSGQGYIRISDGNVEIGCPNAIKQKSAVWSKAGPAGVKTALRGFNQSEGPYNIQYKFSDELGTPLGGLPHLFEMRSDQVTQAAGSAGSTQPALSAQSEETRTMLHYPSIKANQDTDL
uniref:Rhs element Vgr protein n=1 Tax=Burkholderia sp. (strain CCGE1003) TaxID=640512 RepID=E1TAN1_BURSG